MVAINISGLLVSFLLHFIFSFQHLHPLDIFCPPSFTLLQSSSIISLFIIQVIIDDLSTCFIPCVIITRGDKLALLAESGEGVVDIKFTTITGPQCTECRWSPRDVDIVLVVRWRMAM